MGTSIKLNQKVTYIFFFLVISFLTAAIAGCKSESTDGPTGPYNDTTIAVPVTPVYVGGRFTVNGNDSLNNIGTWYGKYWDAMDGGVSGHNVDVECMAFYNNELYVGGFIDSAGGKPAKGIARWDGSSWSAVGSGVEGRVTSLIVYKGELYVGGWFSTAGGLQADNIAKWNGYGWSTVGEGFSDEVYTLCIYHDLLYAGGWFTENHAGYVNANRIARWDGVAWDTVGSGVNSPANIGNWIKTLTVYEDELYAMGKFDKCGNLSVSNIARWDGHSWKEVGTLTVPAQIYASTVFQDELHIVGQADNSGLPYYAVWNGTQWNTNLFTFDSWPESLFSDNESLYVGGMFTEVNGKTVNGIFNFDGSSIHNVGQGVNGFVSSILIK